MQIVIDDEKIIDLLETEWGYVGIREDVRRLLIENGTPLEDIVDGIKSHKWGNNEGSKEIYNNAIDDVLTYIEEKLGE